MASVCVSKRSIDDICDNGFSHRSGTTDSSSVRGRLPQRWHNPYRTSPTTAASTAIDSIIYRNGISGNGSCSDGGVTVIAGTRRSAAHRLITPSPASLTPSTHSGNVSTAVAATSTTATGAAPIELTTTMANGSGTQLRMHTRATPLMVPPAPACPTPVQRNRDSGESVKVRMPQARCGCEGGIGGRWNESAGAATATATASAGAPLSLRSHDIRVGACEGRGKEELEDNYGEEVKEADAAISTSVSSLCFAPDRYGVCAKGGADAVHRSRVRSAFAQQLQQPRRQHARGLGPLQPPTTSWSLVSPPYTASPTTAMGQAEVLARRQQFPTDVEARVCQTGYDVYCRPQHYEARPLSSFTRYPLVTDDGEGSKSDGASVTSTSAGVDRGIKAEVPVWGEMDASGHATLSADEDSENADDAYDADKDAIEGVSEDGTLLSCRSLNEKRRPDVLPFLPSLSSVPYRASITIFSPQTAVTTSASAITTAARTVDTALSLCLYYGNPNTSVTPLTEDHPEWRPLMEATSALTRSTLQVPAALKDAAAVVMIACAHRQPPLKLGQNRANPQKCNSMTTAAVVAPSTEDRLRAEEEQYVESVAALCAGLVVGTGVDNGEADNSCVSAYAEQRSFGADDTVAGNVERSVSRYRHRRYRLRSSTDDGDKGEIRSVAPPPLGYHSPLALPFTPRDGSITATAATADTASTPCTPVHSATPVHDFTLAMACAQELLGVNAPLNHHVSSSSSSHPVAATKAEEQETEENTDGDGVMAQVQLLELLLLYHDRENEKPATEVDAVSTAMLEPARAFATGSEVEGINRERRIPEQRPLPSVSAAAAAAVPLSLSLRSPPVSALALQQKRPSTPYSGRISAALHAAHHARALQERAALADRWTKADLRPLRH